MHAFHLRDGPAAHERGCAARAPGGPLLVRVRGRLELFCAPKCAWVSDQGGNRPGHGTKFPDGKNDIYGGLIR